MAKLTIVAHIKAHRDKVELVKAELKKLVAPTLAEEGCLQYDLHQDNDDPSVFMFYENWESRAVWQKHMAAPHLAAYSKVVEGAVKEFIVHEMTHTT